MPKFAWIDRIGNLTGVKFILSASGSSKTLYIGVNYPIIAFTILLDTVACVASLGLVFVARTTTTSFWAQAISVALCVSHPIFCLLVMFADPGIVAPMTKLDKLELGQRQLVVCSDCDAAMGENENVLHCVDCGVCIRDQHHHCTFTAKCIGRNNRIYFWLWITTLCASFLVPPLLLAS